MCGMNSFAGADPNSSRGKIYAVMAANAAKQKTAAGRKGGSAAQRQDTPPSAMGSSLPTSQWTSRLPTGTLGGSSLLGA